MLKDNRLQSKTKAAELLFLRNTFLFSVFRQEYEFRRCSLYAFPVVRCALSAPLVCEHYLLSLDGQPRKRLALSASILISPLCLPAARYKSGEF